MFGQGIAPKEIISRLFNPFNMKILDLYLETLLWYPLICAEKALQGGVDVWDYVKTYTFNNFVFFNTFCFIIIVIIIYIIILPFLLVSISHNCCYCYY